jgi:Tol biopolymer transport system component/tRNA A-37 threonylcarbamoyl transferase component Bud32
MGEVYRARDTRLGREVAIKVLPAERLSDEQRRARFVQEARAASALNHPHIVTIYDIASAEGTEFIVMELVPGKTLDALIPRHGMRLGEVLRIAIPLADALAAAHGAGIVHRDLKPANVMVTPEGVVKVLDFGLAKLTQAEEGAPEDATTLDARAKPSHPGTVAGTPAYMSPEQASGRKVDARSDVFAFGAVLYEMVTGRRPFGGGSTAEMLASLLKEQPKPPSEVVPDVPKELERIILHCLRKEPARRFQHMVDVKVEIEELKEDSDSQALAPAGRAGVKGRARRRWIALGAASILVLGTVAAIRLWRPELPPPTVVQLTWERRVGSGSFSPDGTQIVFGSAGEKGTNWDIWLKIVGQGEARRLTDDPATENNPAWSPDGAQIAFLRAGGAGRSPTIHLVSPLGGPARRLSELPAGTPSWSPDGRWLAAAKARSGDDPPGGIYLISAATAESRAVTLPKPPAFDSSPSFSPDGRTLAYASCEGAVGMPVCDVYVLSLGAEYKPTGRPRLLVRQRRYCQGNAWTRDGRWILCALGGAFLRARADGGAAPERVELVRSGTAPSTSRTRDRLAFVRSTQDFRLSRIPLGGGTPTLLFESATLTAQPALSPDGLRIAFASRRQGGVGEIWLVDADGSNSVRLTHGPGHWQGSPQWSPDGRSIAFDSQADTGRSNVWAIGVDGTGLRQITDGFSNIVPSWSRDGRFIYLQSDRTGRRVVWRIAVGSGTGEQVTREEGTLPFESFDGRTLYYQSGGALRARPKAGGEERTVLPCVFTWGWAVGPRGIVHVDCGPATPPRTVRYWDATTGQDRVVATLEADGTSGLSVSSDGESLVYVGYSLASDLMMIENFR